MSFIVCCRVYVVFWSYLLFLVVILLWSCWWVGVLNKCYVVMRLRVWFVGLKFLLFRILIRCVLFLRFCVRRLKGVRLWWFIVGGFVVGIVCSFC